MMIMPPTLRKTYIIFWIEKTEKNESDSNKFYILKITLATILILILLGIYGFLSNPETEYRNLSIPPKDQMPRIGWDFGDWKTGSRPYSIGLGSINGYRKRGMGNNLDSIDYNIKVKVRLG